MADQDKLPKAFNPTSLHWREAFLYWALLRQIACATLLWQNQRQQDANTTGLQGEPSTSKSLQVPECQARPSPAPKPRRLQQLPQAATAQAKQDPMTMVSFPCLQGFNILNPSSQRLPSQCPCHQDVCYCAQRLPTGCSLFRKTAPARLEPAGNKLTRSVCSDRVNCCM